MTLVVTDKIHRGKWTIVAPLCVMQFPVSSESVVKHDELADLERIHKPRICTV